MKLNLLIIGILTIGLFSCGEIDEIVENADSEISNELNEQEIEFEAIIEAINNNENLGEVKSLFYSKDNGATEEVTLYLNDSNVSVKMYHEYTAPNGQSLSSNTYHFKDGILISTKELFEVGTIEKGHFTERKTYYNEKEKPIITKQRNAPFEDGLDVEQFSIVKNQMLSYQKPMDILNQEGEFETAFQGFVEEKPYLYMVVGESKPEGYYAALVVQYMTPFIKNLQQNEKDMMGIPLNVNFETLSGEQGYVYQILMGVNKK